MKKGLLLLSIFCFSLISEAQVYFLNEDFSTASGGTPPAGWTIERTGGLASDSWKFNNPGGRSISFPVIGNFAIFDSQRESPTGGAEKVSLVSPFVDCSFSQQILLYFDHQFVGGRQGKGTVEIFDGNNWVASQVYTDSTSGIESAVLNISALAGGKSNARFRFTWEGDSSYYWLVDNVKIFAPLTRDAGIRAIETPTMPFSSGVNAIRVSIVNEGVETLTSAAVKWTVDGVAQTPYSWTGSLALGQAATGLQIGTYNFPSGLLKNVKVWVENPNGQADLNRLNDTLQRRLAAQLCGTYTIGGVNPDFTTFSDAVSALNAAGVGCPVVFKVRDGVYNEQLKIYDVLGSSAVNTIMFESESGDSSKVDLHYTVSNPSNDFTLSLSGTDHISFSKMSIRRTNGANSMVIQSGSHYVTFSNARLGNVVSSSATVDSVLTFRNNNMQGFDLTLDQPVGGASSITVEDNILRSILVSNSKNISVKRNRFGYIKLSAVVNVDFSGNRTSAGDLPGESNTGLIQLRDCQLINAYSNIVSPFNYSYTGVYINGGRLINFYDNKISIVPDSSVSQPSPFPGMYFYGSLEHAIVVQGFGSINGPVNVYNNFIDSRVSSSAIRIESHDSVSLSRNIIEKNINTPQSALGIDAYNIRRLVADSNIINGFNGGGMVVRRLFNSGLLKIRLSRNVIRSISGTGLSIIDNAYGTMPIYLMQPPSVLDTIEVVGNRIIGATSGIGIYAKYTSLIANNYVQIGGIGISKGIVLDSVISGNSGIQIINSSRVVFNSVNITGTDVDNGMALEIRGRGNYTIKNNIFSNKGGGYAAYIGTQLSTGDFNYNNYFSSKRRVGYYNGTLYESISGFSAATGKDVNSYAINPYYTSDTLLIPSHNLLNDAGISYPGVSNDVDNVTRGANPDLGSKEFNACINDAGINDFADITSPVAAGSLPIKVVLQNQGSGSLTSTVIGWSVNGVLQASYNWIGSLSSKQSEVVTIGNYIFGSGSVFDLKAWTQGANGGSDCSVYNDTSLVLRVGTQLCGTYTIGGVNPDFTTFSDAVSALNAAGVGCPVVFKVRDGVYNEQLKIYDVLGSSAVNTIMFESESGDSSKVDLHYTVSNPSNDFTLSLSGTDHISFSKMSIRRTNGANSMVIQSGSHYVTFSNARLGNVVSSSATVDSVLTFRNNNMQGFDLTLDQPVGGASSITVEDNILRSILVSNSKNISVKRNRFGYIKLSAVVNVDFSGNRTSAGDLPGESNTGLIQLRDCQLINAYSNIVSPFNYSYTGVYINGGRLINFYDNKISIVPDSSVSQPSPFPGMYFYGSLEHAIVVQGFGSINGPVNVYNNFIDSRVSSSAIRIESHDSVSLSRNIIEKNINTPQSALGIDAYNIRRLVADSNIINGFNGGGMVVRRLFNSGLLKIRLSRNVIRSISGTGLSIIDNAYGTMPIYLMQPPSVLDTIEVVGNRIIGATSGIGIYAKYTSLIANNYVQIGGIGISKGIVLDSVISGNSGIQIINSSRVVFNSVNITGTDVDNGMALEIRGRGNYTIKNNIFSNKGGGYAAYIGTQLSTGDFNYNNYFSSKRRVGYYNGTLYESISGFSAATGKDVNSYAINPYYTSDTLLIPSHNLLNDAGISYPGVSNDVDNVTRGANPDLGSKEFNACINDAGINDFADITSPVAAGSLPIKVVLQNQGSGSLTSTVIGWSVNGVLQASYNWIGSLSSKQSEVVTIGNYIFGSGSVFDLKAWTQGANGGSDCSVYNDTSLVLRVGTQLCGTYTIGGVNPDFTTFSDAVSALNAAGVGCPVVFKVRDGVYNEQLKIYDVLGSSAVNTIMFESESGDSSKVDLHYTVSNPSNDFTLSLSGTDHISFSKMSIRRTNGANSMVIQSGSHYVTFSNARLGNVVSSSATVDSVLTFRNNNMQGFDLTLDQPVGGASSITVEDNILRSILVSNSKNISVKRNRFGYIKLSAVVNVDFSGNRTSAGDLPGESNTGLIQLRDCQLINAYSNIVSPFNYSYTGVYINGGRLINFYDNKISIVPDSSVSQPSPFPGMYFYGSLEHAIVVQGFGSINGPVNVYNNFIDSRVSSSAIRIESHDSVSLSRNIIEKNINTPQSALGIDAYNIRRLVADSNIINGFNGGGMVVRRLFNSGLLKIRLSRNVIRSISGTGLSIIDNAYGTMPIYLMQPPSVLDTIEVVGNRIIGATSGIGIYAKYTSLIANNYVQIGGIGISKGIVLDSVISGNSGIQIINSSRVVFNSVNITGTDVDNGMALEIRGRGNYTIKNNIFSNKGGGYAAYINALSTTRDWDYNNYYSSSENRFGYIAGQNFNSLGSWGAVLGGDANSKHLNPVFASDTLLQPYEKRLNGAGIGVADVPLDIDGEIRNQQAPDMGAQEFMVDFGITRVVSPENNCPQGVNAPIKVALRQYGDVPFIDLKLAYQINGGTIVYDTVPGTITNDIEYTFDQKSILSTTGDNVFKVWLVDNADDNTVNDTLVNVIKIGETFNPLPASLRLETGQTIELDGGTGHSSYLWSTGDTTRKITVNQLGTYSVKVNINTICEVADTVVVTNCVVSGYNPFADTTSLCAKTAQLDAGSGYLVYNWSNTQSTQQITVTQSGWYKVTVTNEIGCLGTDSTYFSLINADIIQSDTTICLNVSKSLAVDPIAGTSILWSTGDTTSSITVTPAQTTTYSVTVTDGITSCSDQVTVTVVPVDTSVTVLDALAICPGTSTRLQAGNGSSYKWLRDGAVISGATSKQYSASIAGDYRVVVTNANGCSDTSRAIRVTMKDNPKAGSWNTVAAVCSGTNTATLQIRGNVGTLRWQYSTNGTTYVDMEGLTDSMYLATNLTSTRYYRVIATNSCGSDTSAVQTVVVNPTPVVSFTVNNATQSLSGNLFTFTNTTPETTGDTYVWALGNGFTVTTRNTSFSYTLPGTYSVSLTVRTALGCESTTQQVIEVVDLPEAGQITGSATVCGDVNSNALSVTGSSGTLQWQQSANNISFSNINSATSSSYTATNLSATTYFRVIASKNGLFDTSGVATIIVNPKPTVSFNVNNATQVLTGNSFVFTNTSTGGSTYLWRFGNGATATTQNATYSYAAAGSYVVRLVVTSAAGCQDSTSTTVTVTAPQPPVAGQISGSASVCGPVNSNTISVAGSSGTLQWQQSANNISFSNINSATSSSYTATNLSVTTYFRVIASRDGLTDTSGVATITFNPTPEASFSINDSTQTIDGNQFVFTNTSNAVSGSTFLWDLGDGFYTSNRSVTYTYQSSGIFDVKLHVETGAGCSSDFIRRVYVIEAPVARDDQFTVDEDNVLTGNAALNDRQSNDGGNNWTLLGANGGALNGTVVMQSNGLFTYTPKSNYNGLELFKYTLCDVNGDCDTANVLITVNAVDDFPLAFQDVFNTAHATTLTGSVSLNDTASADGGNVWSLVQFNGGSKGGTITMATTGLFSYTPRQGYSGTDSIRYQLCDVDGDCVQAYLLITVAAGTPPPPPPPPPPPVAAGNLFAAGTTCAQFNAQTASALSRLCYTVSSGRVSAVTPSSFMYYVKVTAPSASFTVNISQTVSRTGFRLFTVNTGGSVVNGDNCARVTSVSSPSTGQARASVTRATVGRTYIIGVRYDTRSLVGYTTNGTLSANYTFVARIGNSTLSNSTSTVTLYPNNCVGVSSGQLARMPELGGLPGASAGVDKTGSEVLLQIRVYPNPSNSRFNVLIEGSDRQTKGVLRIMNAQGQIVEEIKDVKPGMELQLGMKYTSGTYTAVFIQGTQTTRQRMVRY